MAFLIIAFVLLFIITSVPSLWTKHILNKYSKPHPDIPGSGHQFAEHLINKYQLNIRVEETQEGDHYDPINKVVRLSPENYHANSLTAITTVAHEIGHALQDQANYEPLKQRTVLIERARWMQQMSGIALMATPILIPLMHTPMIGLVTFAAGFIGMGVPVIIHLSTLPVEFDASYNRALPLLKEGGYLSNKDLKTSKRILTACAMTYVSASLSSLFNLWKWLRALKRH
ncbi:zinc metallopeptidase [Hydrogenovibrio marinus]|uniref:Peptidase membrane zinc metallopeptidase n=1 Tax=Hydrogenovibrio marinus TaxID=28885 RepID=A0A066ZS35_HYDMR|nr:zinc metallopeptidase [Hydrogenovibrio marinus]KDN96292.1 peptidase membrane zinc metallopeptidase [Hydrogenovibrio marinus]BBN60524.1 zinc metallopeptidase [Hydrogenovibrio marinus]